MMIGQQLVPPAPVFYLIHFWWLYNVKLSLLLNELLLLVYWPLTYQCLTMCSVSWQSSLKLIETFQQCRETVLFFSGTALATQDGAATTTLLYHLKNTSQQTVHWYTKTLKENLFKRWSDDPEKYTKSPLKALLVHMHLLYQRG